jgi:hypothetical protein
VREITMKNTSLWMAVLTFTAIILAAILLTSGERPAQAAMINAQPNFTLMTTGINGGDEALVVIDKGRQKMIIYMYRGNELLPVAGRSIR